MKPSFKQIASNFDWGTQKNHENGLLKKLRGLIFNDKIMEIILGNQIGA